MNTSNKKNTIKQLDKKTKFWYIFLIIITFGIFYFYIKNKINKVKNNINNKTTSKIKKSNFDINKLIQSLGTISNIEDIEISLSTIKIYFKNKQVIDIEQIKKLGAKGTMFSNNKLNIVFGDNAIEIFNSLQEIIKANNEK